MSFTRLIDRSIFFGDSKTKEKKSQASQREADSERSESTLKDPETAS